FRMVCKNPHDLMDRIAAEQDRLIASRLRKSKHVLSLARQNLRRWMTRDGRHQRPVFAEWDRVLRRLSAAEIADFLESATPMARRLSQSSPFAGVLSDTERLAIQRKHEKART
ncbi:MAG: hypothetical protein NTW03_15895, partial [Verrucomicrobia bacterium]|nr:hypothetical protein [Verrucomicrobiota bacterium]